MYTSVGYETYGEYEVFAGGLEAMAPADNTIARGHSLYGYDNTNAGYDLARATLTNPDAAAVDFERGKAAYDIYCAICHGSQGKGDGYLVKNEKILGVPSYDAREITEGSVYHVIYFGRNTMGSYANQLNEEERWQVSAYVMNLRNALTQN
jgi:mono/diheme cytochrome c family protein